MSEIESDKNLDYQFLTQILENQDCINYVEMLQQLLNNLFYLQERQEEPQNHMIFKKMNNYGQHQNKLIYQIMFKIVKWSID
ncbi:unnamed protein product [Paramecium sonneborni]|uniref:Uncharacterized protein n=1 Tax=Paramecium sonneborni TaxID=65129 RepID=A0A8S1NNF5_9CILI|nr:unnamed protein product [Paramecium sonneborni]